MSSILAFANGKQQIGTAHVDRTLSEERARNAALWVEKEVDKLVTEIAGIGKKVGGEVHVTFGELFHRYQDVSDTLVGILQRAKKRGLIKYQGEGGDLLLQGRHNHVVITLDHAKAMAWQKEYQASGGKIPTAPASLPSSAPKKPATIVTKSAPQVTTSTVNKLQKPSGIGATSMTANKVVVSSHVAGKQTLKKAPDQNASPALLACIGFVLLVLVLIVLYSIARFLFGR